VVHIGHSSASANGGVPSRSVSRRSLRCECSERKHDRQSRKILVHLSPRCSLRDSRDPTVSEGWSLRAALRAQSWSARCARRKLPRSVMIAPMGSGVVRQQPPYTKLTISRPTTCPLGHNRTVSDRGHGILLRFPYPCPQCRSKDHQGVDQTG